MLSLLEALETSAFATWVREADTVFAYYFVLASHAIGLAFLVGLSAAIDLRILGVAPRLPLAPMEGFFPVMLAGLWVNVLSGLVLFATQPVSLAKDPIFYAKLGFIALGVLTLRLIRRELFLGSPVSLAAATPPLPARAKTLACASLAFWTLVIVTGRMLAYPGFVRWATAGVLLIVTIVALLAGVIGAHQLGRRAPLRHDV